MTEQQKQRIYQEYSANNMAKLRQMIYRPISSFGGFVQMDYDDFLSRANLTLWQLTESYDESQGVPFNAYLRTCMANKIRQEKTYQGRKKRTQYDREGNGIPALSLEALLGEGHTERKEFLVSDFDVERELPEEFGFSKNERVLSYLSQLSGKQQRIAGLIMEGYRPAEIREELGMSQREYQSAMSMMKSYEKSKYLRRDTEDDRVRREDYTDMEHMITTSEKTKDTHYSIEAISKKMKRYQLRDDHVLQRTSGQWGNLYKSELISDILQGKSLTQIIISEEVRDGIAMHWLIDGKQRCTNIDEFLHDGFAISKNIQRYEIQYQTTRKDESGNAVLNAEGFVVPVIRSFDIRKKKFSQLPEELQDRFREYQLPVMLNLNCTKKEIAYDIARFNRCRPMNVAQNGWTGLSEEHAEFVDHILKMPFFSEDCPVTSYRESHHRTGMLRRMIVEGIMTVNYMEDFSKDFRKMCEYLSEEASESVFIEFYAMVERLNEIGDEAFAQVFTVKDSFLWFGLFSRFEKLGAEAGAFIGFVREFQELLHSKKINGISFDQLCECATKDKAIVKRKVNHLEKLLLAYLGK